jgi:hypothetical protein
LKQQRQEGNDCRKIQSKEKNQVKTLQEEGKNKREKEKVKKRCLAELARKEEKERTQVLLFLLYVSFIKFLAPSFLFVLEKYQLFLIRDLEDSVLSLLFFSNNNGTTMEVGLGLDPSSLSLLIPIKPRKDRCICIHFHYFVNIVTS